MEGYRLSLSARKRELKKLIKDAKELKFNKVLISNYEIELANIDVKLKEIKEEMERFKRLEDD